MVRHSAMLAAALFAVSSEAAYPTSDDLMKIMRPSIEAAAQKYNCSFGISFKSDNVTATMTSGEIVPGYTPNIYDKWVWGSVTKVLTGSTVLQLANKGSISLNDSVPSRVDSLFARTKPFNFSSCEDLWGPDINTVTVRDLLAMQSCIPDFDTAIEHEGKMTDSFRAAVYANPGAEFSPYQLMNVPWVHTGSLMANCTPGPAAGYRYSSTNFLLLGLIAAEFYGASEWDKYDQSTVFPDSIKERFVNLSYADHGNPSNYSKVVGFDRTHYNGEPGNSGEFQGVNVYHTDGVFSGWTASNLVGDVGAVADVYHSVYGPEYLILDKEYVDMMIPTAPYYGLATFNLSSKTGNLSHSLGYGTAYGHVGATYGYQSMVTYHPGFQFTLSIASNIERDVQDQPSDLFCNLYNTIMAFFLDKPGVDCVYTAGSYYTGTCDCKFTE